MTDWMTFYIGKLIKQFQGFNFFRITIQHEGGGNTFAPKIIKEGNEIIQVLEAYFFHF